MNNILIKLATFFDEEMVSVLQIFTTILSRLSKFYRVWVQIHSESNLSHKFVNLIMKYPENISLYSRTSKNTKIYNQKKNDRLKKKKNANNWSNLLL